MNGPSCPDVSGRGYASAVASAGPRPGSGLPVSKFWFSPAQKVVETMAKRSKAQTPVGVQIDTGEELGDFPADDGKNKAAQSLGQLGGRARAKALSARRRKEIAQKAAHALEDIGRPPKTKMVPRPRRSAQQGARGGV